jgi:photosystem II stability/assembly factor-like uncharacterized protein
MKTKYLFFIILLFSIINPLICSKHGNWKLECYWGPQKVFTGISNADSNYVMAIGNNGFTGMFIDISTKGGKMWYHLYNDTAMNLVWPQEISYPTPDFAIIGCDSTTFYSTKDTGKTWEKTKIDLQHTVRGFYNVSMNDRNNGILASRYYIAISHDGFDTWDTVLSPGGKNMIIYTATMAGPNSVCLISRQYGDTTYNMRFFRSDDGCKSWNEFPHLDYIEPTKIKFVDSLIGYEIGSESVGYGDARLHYVFKTIDGGRTWLRILDTLDNPPFGLSDLDFYDKDNILIASKYGKMYWTHNGGKTWLFDSSATLMAHQPFTMYPCYIRKTRAIAVDFNAYVYVSDSFFVAVEDVPTGTYHKGLKAYPNPVSELLTIELPDILVFYKDLRFYDSYCREIKDIRYYKQPSSGKEVTIDVSTFPVGIYYAIFKTRNRAEQIPFVVIR